MDSQLHESARFGLQVERFLLPIVYYLWEWGVAPVDRRTRINRSTDRSRRELLAAVRPFAGELEAALEAPQGPPEARLLQDFADTYEEVLEMVGVSFEEIPASWDSTFLTKDRSLNKTLLFLYRGLDLIEFDLDEEAEPWLRKGRARLEEISRRRQLPPELRRFRVEVEERIRAHLKARQEAERDSQIRGAFLPRVEDVLSGRAGSKPPDPVQSALPPDPVLDIQLVEPEPEPEPEAMAPPAPGISEEDRQPTEAGPAPWIRPLPSPSMDLSSLPPPNQDLFGSSDSGVQNRGDPNDPRLFGPDPRQAPRRARLIELIAEMD